VSDERRIGVEAGSPRDSANIGLKNLDERYQLIMQKGIQIENSGTTFTVFLPLLKSS
jgi:hypothetical protein